MLRPLLLSLCVCVAKTIQMDIRSERIYSKSRWTEWAIVSARPKWKPKVNGKTNKNGRIKQRLKWFRIFEQVQSLVAHTHYFSFFPLSDNSPSITTRVELFWLDMFLINGMTIWERREKQTIKTSGIN